jgi:hypothetical protein
VTVADLYLTVFNAAYPVVITVPVWGPLLLIVTVAVMWWQLAPARARRAVRTVSGRVRAGVRTRADSVRADDTRKPLTSADTSPDMSADTETDVSGHDSGGTR